MPAFHNPSTPSTPSNGNGTGNGNGMRVDAPMFQPSWLSKAVPPAKKTVKSKAAWTGPSKNTASGARVTGMMAGGNDGVTVTFGP